FNFCDLSSSCEAEKSYAYDKLVQIPESTLAAIAFFCLSRYVRRLWASPVFVFWINSADDTVKVQQGYTQELDSSFRLLTWILLPIIPGGASSQNSFWF
ncbi:hypothetical protein KI387_002827, partial [Taxus chinensis]